MIVLKNNKSGKYFLVDNVVGKSKMLNSSTTYIALSYYETPLLECKDMKVLNVIRTALKSLKYNNTTEDELKCLTILLICLSKV